MPIVEVFGDKDALEPLFIADFDFLPRLGGYLARDIPASYFVHHKVVEISHRQDAEGVSSAPA